MQVTEPHGEHETGTVRAGCVVDTQHMTATCLSRRIICSPIVCQQASVNNLVPAPVYHTLLKCQLAVAAVFHTLEGSTFLFCW